MTDTIAYEEGFEQLLFEPQIIMMRMVTVMLKSFILQKLV